MYTAYTTLGAIIFLGDLNLVRNRFSNQFEDQDEIVFSFVTYTEIA